MNLIGLLVALIILALIFWVLIWFVDWVGLPEPFNKVVKVVIALVIVIYLLSLLGGFAPLPPVLVRR